MFRLVLTECLLREQNADFTYDQIEHSARHPIKVKVSGATDASISETMNTGVD